MAIASLPKAILPHDRQARFDLDQTNPLSMLTHERPLSQIQAAFEICENYADGVGKMTIRF